MTDLVRINKFLSEQGICSRRAADKFLEQGRITIDGEIPLMGTKIGPHNEVRLDGKIVSHAQKEFTYLAFNKPVGIVCTTDTKREKDNIIDYIAYPERIFPIGRLDKPSEGLILLTSDGDIVNKILCASNGHEKEYIVTVDKPITQKFLQGMANGVPILDTITKRCEIEQLGKFVFRIILTQGLNRQIRRMSEYFGYDVIKLKRVRVMNITLDVPSGHYRTLRPEELKELMNAVKHSSKTFKPQTKP